jgi:hypothetical protein
LILAVGRVGLLNMIVNFTQRARRDRVARPPTWWLSALVAALLLALAAPARADADSAEVEAQRLVHILGYVAADYGAAVEHGAVINEDEYKEQLTLLDDAARIVGRLEKTAPAGTAGLAAGLSRVRALVEAKAAARPTRCAGALCGTSTAPLATARPARPTRRAPPR